MTRWRRHLVAAAIIAATALAFGVLLDAIDAGRTATLLAACCFVAVAVPMALIAIRLRRRN